MESESEIFHFDNNSGTYAPKLSGLILLKELLTLNFPETKFMIHDRKEMERIRAKLLNNEQYTKEDLPKKEIDVGN